MTASYHYHDDDDDARNDNDYYGDNNNNDKNILATWKDEKKHNERTQDEKHLHIKPSKHTFQKQLSVRENGQISKAKRNSRIYQSWPSRQLGQQAGSMFLRADQSRRTPRAPIRTQLFHYWSPQREQTTRRLQSGRRDNGTETSRADEVSRTPRRMQH